MPSKNQGALIFLCSLTGNDYIFSEVSQLKKKRKLVLFLDKCHCWCFTVCCNVIRNWFISVPMCSEPGSVAVPQHVYTIHWALPRELFKMHLNTFVIVIRCTALLSISMHTSAGLKYPRCKTIFNSCQLRPECRKYIINIICISKICTIQLFYYSSEAKNLC